MLVAVCELEHLFGLGFGLLFSLEEILEVEDDGGLRLLVGHVEVWNLMRLVDFWNVSVDEVYAFVGPLFDQGYWREIAIRFKSMSGSILELREIQR